jgi:phage-related minor tail protein
MADDLENSGEWRDTVDTRLSKLESTVEEQTRLRAAMDKDVGDLKAGLGAQVRLIQAISDTQSDHTRQIRELRDHVDEKFEAVEGRLGTVEGRLGAVEGRLEAVAGKLGAVDGRLEAVAGRLGAVESTLETVHVGVDLIIGKLDRLTPSDS